MKSIDAIQDEIIRDFQDIGDEFDKYAYLIELSCAFEPMKEEEKTPNRLVEGCQSSVWLKCYADKDGNFCFSADSNTLIIKGILALLQKVLCHQPPQEAARADLRFLKEADILSNFESSRQKGVGFVIAQLKKSAETMSAKIS